MSLAEQAYNIVKKDIISGKLIPSQELPEKWLAEELGISRTPVREALARLATESLIDETDQKIARVASFTQDDVMESMEIRTLLEVYNAKRITPLVSKQLLEALSENLDLQKESIEAKSYESFIDYDRQFHLILAEANPNSKLVHFIKEANTGVKRAFLVLSNSLTMSAEQAYTEHQDIVIALSKGDVHQVEKAMHNHMIQIEQRIYKYYQKGEIE